MKNKHDLYPSVMPTQPGYRTQWNEHKSLPPVLQRIKDDLIRRGKWAPSNAQAHQAK